MSAVEEKLEEPPMKTNMHYDPYASGMANKDDWSVYATSHPCSSCFTSVSECFPSLCSDACDLYETDTLEDNANVKAIDLSKKRCFFQSLQDLAIKLQRRKQNAIQRKKLDKIVEQPINVVSIFEPNKNQLYCAGSIIGKQTWYLDRPCSKYFSEVTDACLCLCRDACAKYDFEYEVTGNEALDKLQKDLFFFQFLQEWAFGKVEKATKSLNSSNKVVEPSVSLTTSRADDNKHVDQIIPLTAMVRCAKQAIKHKVCVDDDEPIVKKHKPEKAILFCEKAKQTNFWDIFAAKFPDQKRSAVFICPESKQKSEVFKLLYSVGSHHPNEWLCKDDKIFLHRESGGVITSKRDWHGNQITRADGVPKENSLLKFQFHFDNLPHTYFMVWKPHHRWSKCPATELFCNGKCPKPDTCPKASK
jgi:hypothetical protein